VFRNLFTRPIIRIVVALLIPVSIMALRQSASQQSAEGAAEPSPAEIMLASVETGNSPVELEAADGDTGQTAAAAGFAASPSMADPAAALAEIRAAMAQTASSSPPVSSETAAPYQNALMEAIDMRAAAGLPVPLVPRVGRPKKSPSPPSPPSSLIIPSKPVTTNGRPW
jgi:hypothetical protein